MLPLVAIVGRPNVGKSTLVNRIATTSNAIVHRESGVTRDRNYIQTDWGGKLFTLIDTGGLRLESETSLLEGIPLPQAVTKQALLAVEEAEVVIFVVDGAKGLFPEESEIAQLLRKSKKPLLLAVNKIDHPALKSNKFDFYRLGLEEPLEISALHGLGIGDLLDKLTSLLPAVSEVEKKVDLNIAIVGRPNVGKSTLVNHLLKEPRAIVDKEAGTTRDTVSSFLEYDNKRYSLFDTAGLKKKSRILEDLEYYGLVRTLRTLGKADLALIVLDATEGLTRQDLRIAELAKERGCASTILLNKKDLVGQTKLSELSEEVRGKLNFLSYAPTKSISALTGAGISTVFSLIERVGKEYQKRIPTPKLNQFVQGLKGKNLPSKRGQNLKIFYAVQIEKAPPAFTFFVNSRKLVSSMVGRYLEKALRKAFGFEGTPLRLYFREKQ